MELDPGTVIDRYEVETRLGKGGMATVYRVRHTGLGTRFALKVLSHVEDDLVRRLVREGRLQGALSHPNVLKVSDLVDVGGSPGLILEYVSGWTLSELLEHPLTRPQIDWLARGMLAGVVAAHDNGLIHRDIKPDNVLLAWSKEGYPVPKVADFGLARLVEAAAVTGRLTRGSLGTPGYMAPEQVVDAASVDARADVFSLGAVLYEMVTGERAFPGGHAFEVLDRVRIGEYRPPMELSADLPPAWVRAIDGALVGDEDARTQDVATLLAHWTEGSGSIEPP